MRDAQKGRKSWLERLTSPPESETEEQYPGDQYATEQPQSPTPYRVDQRNVERERAPLRDVRDLRELRDREREPAAQEGYETFAPPVPAPTFREEPRTTEPERPVEVPVSRVDDHADFRPRDLGRDEREDLSDRDEEMPTVVPGVPGPSSPSLRETARDDAWGSPVSAPVSASEDSARAEEDDDIDAVDDSAQVQTATAPSSWQPDPAPTSSDSERPGLDLEPEVPVSVEDEITTSPSEEEQLEAARKRHVEELQHRWLVTQAQLLDDPRDAVREAGLLIGDAMQFVTSTFTDHRDRIEREWKNNDELDTDELRTIMRRYRNLFQYVLSASQLPDL